MTKKLDLGQLSRREREIMDIVYRLGRATVTEVMRDMSDDLGNSTVRKQINILEEKGFLRHKQRKNVNVYFPTIKREMASSTMMKHVLDTFFHGSVSQAFMTLMKVSDDQLSEDDKQKITEMIETSRKEGR